MTDYIPAFNITSTGTVYDLQQDENIYVGEGIQIASTSAEAVVGGVDSFVHVDGTLAGEYGVGLESNSTLHVGEHGNLKGFNAGVYGYIGASYVYNEGHIYGAYEGIQCINGYLGLLENTGTIEGGYLGQVTIGVYLLTSGTSYINNSGVIKSTMSGGYSILSSGNSIEIIKNSGSMIGNVSLGKKDDVFDTSLGTVSGWIDGGEGQDRITGSALTDIIMGGSEADTLQGREGRDFLTGGTGSDTFLFKTVSASRGGVSGTDRITDFKHVELDEIDLSSIDANIDAIGNQDFRFIGDKGFTGNAGDLRTKIFGSDTLVRGDVNGDGKVDIAIFVHGDAYHKDDFIL